jgi:hypothetical protein
LFEIHDIGDETNEKNQEEEEETDISEWTQDVADTKLHKTSTISGPELDTIKANFESLKDQ